MVALRLACLLVALCSASGVFVDIAGFGSYELIENAVTWFEARAACNNESAHLAVIESSAEFDAIIARFKPNISANGEQIFTGFHSLYIKDEWVTLFDKPIITSGFSDWAYGNPVDGERCGGVCTNPEGLCSQNCTSKLYHLCKKKISS
ncbi:hemolymph lipopolysaccharide-binding protein-like [Bacillus rossius redtenbacheri]|uniref:hemolymph lipopolysaccharide-binding protein-like n=1 Tax=Bacillus rossius redtenbacheri TaxID=93214 RepID=UPI002FDE35EC